MARYVGDESSWTGHRHRGASLLAAENHFLKTAVFLLEDTAELATQCTADRFSLGIGMWTNAHVWSGLSHSARKINTISHLRPAFRRRRTMTSVVFPSMNFMQLLAWVQTPNAHNDPQSDVELRSMPRLTFDLTG